MIMEINDITLYECTHILPASECCNIVMLLSPVITTGFGKENLVGSRSIDMIMKFTMVLPLGLYTPTIINFADGITENSTVQSLYYFRNKTTQGNFHIF